MVRKAVPIPTRAIPTPDEFVSRAPEAEVAVKPVMIRLSVDLPEDVHMRWKLFCVAQRQTMGDAARELIESRLEAVR